MKDKIQEINEEIARLQEDCNDKIEKMIQERDRLIQEQNPPFANPYMKCTIDECDYICKVTDVSYFNNGEVNYYTVKILGINGLSFYHPDNIVTPSRVGTSFQFISKEEFEELLTKGLDLIRKDII